MAEIPFENLFEEPDAAAVVARHDAPASGDAVAMGIALGRAGDDPRLADRIAAFLERQTALLDRQIAALEEEDPLIRAQLREQRIRRLGMRLRNVLLSLVVVAAGFSVLLGALLVFEAAASHRVVVEAFDTPPDLAPAGINGKVVAMRLLDELTRMRDVTRSPDRPLPASSAWASDIKLVIPEAGISIGEIDRLLRQRLGHDIHVSGALVETAAGLSLTVEGDAVPARSFDGPKVGLSDLIRAAAEHVYGRSQPYHFAVYLVSTGRDRDAASFIADAFGRAGNDAEAADLANVWGAALEDLNEHEAAADKFRLAISLRPHFWKPWSNLPNVLLYSEGEEAAWREAQAFLRAVRSASPGERPPLSLMANPAQIVSDMPLYLASELADAKLNAGRGATSVLAAPGVADAYSSMHDWNRAVFFLRQGDPGDPATLAQAKLVAARRAIEEGRAAAAVTDMQAFGDTLHANPSLQAAYTSEPCLLGLAYGMEKRWTEAAAVFAAAGPWAACAAMQGDVLALSGDRAGAQRVWTAGLARAPDLPVITLHRGLDALRRGDLSRAAADLSSAHDEAPFFADPVKGLGDVLARQGRWRAALARYDQALRDAPDWDALRQARSVAAARAAER